MYAMFGAAALVLSIHNTANATQIARELWDSFIPGDRPLGQIMGSKTMVGFDPTTLWIVNSNSPILVVDNNSDNYSPGLPPNMGGGPGDIWSDVYVGTPPFTNTIQDYEDPRSWAVRKLVPEAQINFNANGTYYFSIQLNHGNDGIQGIGFANGTNDAARFVGAGITRDSYSSSRFPVDLGGTVYVSSGTLGQPGDPGDSTYYGTYPVEGPAMVMAYATNGVGATLTNRNPGLLVGKLTTSVGGNANLSAIWFPSGTTNIPTDPSTITWDVSYGFSETNMMTHLLIWLTASSYNNSIDGIRVADSWGEVVGLESRISISPTNVVPTGMPVVFSSYAQNGPVTYQWLSNGVPILNETNAAYTNTFPTTTATYTVVVGNSYGLSTNNPPMLLTVTPASPANVTLNSYSETRYVGGGSVMLSANISGTPPYSFGWLFNGTALSSQTNTTLILNNVQLTNAGSYVVWASNYLGGAQATNVLTVLPIPGSYVAAIMSNQPYAHYDLNETGAGPNVVLRDLAGGHDGMAVDTNVVLGVSGPYYTGFGNNRLGVGSARNAPNGSRINIPIFNYTSNMTICAWVRGNNMGNGIVLGTTGNGWGMDSGDGNQYFGLYFPSANTLGSHWGPASTLFNSDLIVPPYEWTFVALVISPTNTSIYMGHPPEALNVATMDGVNTASSVAIDPNNGTGIGRTDYGWAGPGNAWAGCYGDLSGVSIFYSSLSGDTITNIYSAAGTPLTTVVKASSDNAGNVTLTWPTGATLEQTTDLTSGLWSAVPSPTGTYIVPVSPYTIPANIAQTNVPTFYRTSQ